MFCSLVKRTIKFRRDVLHLFKPSHSNSANEIPYGRFQSFNFSFIVPKTCRVAKFFGVGNLKSQK